MSDTIQEKTTTITGTDGKQTTSVTYNCIRCGGQFYNANDARNHDCRKVGIIEEKQVS